jgi:hypothetical protein
MEVLGNSIKAPLGIISFPWWRFFMAEGKSRLMLEA